MNLQPKELALKIARLLDTKKALDLSLLEVTGVTEIADYFVICTGNSSTQVRAFSEEVEFKLKQEGILPLHIEGHQTKSWVVMDYGSVVVHVFDPEARAYYDLERLWADGVAVPPSEYAAAQE